MSNHISLIAPPPRARQPSSTAKQMPTYRQVQLRDIQNPKDSFTSSRNGGTAIHPISPESTARAAFTSIERSNNHRAMLQHQDLNAISLHAGNFHNNNPNLHLNRTHYRNRSPAPLLRSQLISNTELWEKLAKIKNVFKRALDKRARKLAQARSQLPGRVRELKRQKGSVSAAAGENTAKHYSELPQGPTPQHIPTPIYDSQRKQRTSAAPTEFYRALAAVKKRQEEEQAQQEDNRAFLPPPLQKALPLVSMARKPVPRREPRRVSPRFQAVPRRAVAAAISNSQAASPKRHQSRHASIASASSTNTEHLNPHLARSLPGMITNSNHLTRFSDFMRSNRSSRAPSLGTNGEQQHQQQRILQRCIVCGVAFPVSSVILPYKNPALNMTLCPGCEQHHQRASVELPPPTPPPKQSQPQPQPPLNLRKHPLRHRSGHTRLSQAATAPNTGYGFGFSGPNVPDKVNEEEQKVVWNCEHCFASFASKVPKKGGLCICPVCGREIATDSGGVARVGRQVSLRRGGSVGGNGSVRKVDKGKGKEVCAESTESEKSRFSGVSEVSASRVDDRASLLGSRRGSRAKRHRDSRLKKMEESFSPVSPIGEGQFDMFKGDSVARGSSHFEPKGHTEDHRDSSETRQAIVSRDGISSRIPGLDINRSRQIGPNLQLAYEFDSTPTMSSVATTAMDLDKPWTPQEPPQSRSHLSFLKAKTKERMEAQGEKMEKKSKHVASSIYPTDVEEKVYYTSDKPLPTLPGGATTQCRLSLDKAEMEAVAQMPPLTDDHRASGIWPSNNSRSTLPVNRRSSFYGFYKPLLESESRKSRRTLSEDISPSFRKF